MGKEDSDVFHDAADFTDSTDLVLTGSGRKRAPDDEEGHQSLHKKLQRQPVSEKLPDIREKNLMAIQRRVLSQLNNRRYPKLIGMESEHRKMRNLLEQTVKGRESNSCLVLGPRGSGKSALVEFALEEMQNAYPGEFLVVRLDGRAQTDDSQALHEIGVQLQRFSGVRRTGTGTILSRLLKLFSGERHDGNEGGGEDDDLCPSRETVSVILVLNEFEQFTKRPRQTLLYNLYDVAAHPRRATAAAICVVGISSLMNVAETLEKRVRSRFSHRIIQTHTAASLHDFHIICLSSAQVNSPLNSVADAVVANWNKAMEDLFTRNITLRSAIERAYNTTRDPRSVNISLIAPVRRAGSTWPYAILDSVDVCDDLDFNKENNDFERGLDSGLTRFRAKDKRSGLFVVTEDGATAADRAHELPELSAMMLVCAARIDARTATDTPAQIAFPQVYEEYMTLVGKARLADSASGAIAMRFRVWSTDLAEEAWERLLHSHLVVNGSVELELHELRDLVDGIPREWTRL
ncbi:origin recognition complex subunit 4 C-terminus-domain-containing protein [Dipodascopsis uninucleata]